ncbi:hypothetical protein E3P92_02360 [Wallemia ichthyophaga]|nr:hypothetical protein E3P92_02360 [Wallemia ichthyophaga]TIB33887.1 hypothetical protein E3P84_01991 [Wallemia ichthyophaga]TIB41478.1 hypothetical protein E3P83_01943 [Wallemia ichthyophaga]
MSSENIAGNSMPVDKPPTQQSKQEDSPGLNTGTNGAAGTPQDKRVQWSEGDPIPTDTEGPGDDDPNDETKKQQIEDLKMKLQGGNKNAQVPAGRETDLLPPGQQTNTARFDQYLNFEGADGEFTIPEGETEGLPSLAARKRITKDKSKVGNWLGKIMKPNEGIDQKDVEANIEENRSEMSSDEDEMPPPATTGPTSVLGGLMALKEADKSGSSTPTTSEKSMPLSDSDKDLNEKHDEKDDLKPPQGPAIVVDEEKQAPQITPTPSHADSNSETPTLVQTPGGSTKPSSSLSHSFAKYNPAALAAKGMHKGVHSAMSVASTPGKMAEKVFNEARKTPSQKAERRRRRKEQKKNEIMLNLAALIERQEFLLKLTRALMMFGSPSHRLESVIQNTGKFLEAPVQCMFTPGVMTMSFSDPSTRTSDTKFIKQASGLDLARLPDTHALYSDVLHGKISVTEASAKLDEIMLSPPTYNAFTTVCIGMLCSASITPMAFDGSFIDALMAAVLGAVLVITQMLVAKKDTFSSIFEILIASFNSFIAACLAYSRYFCFKAVVSGSIVLILPGFIILCGSLELTSRNITSGSVRMFYAIIYALLLGFGLGFGAQLWYLFTGQVIDSTDDCSAIQSVPGQNWYMRHAPDEYNILLAPLFVLGLALRNQTRIISWELILMILIGCAGYTVNYFSTNNNRFEGRADISSALASFTVGIIGNVIGRLSPHSAYVLMVPGILFVLPSGFGQFGLLSFANVGGSESSSAAQQTSATQAIAQNLISIANGLTVGLFLSSALINPASSSSRRNQAANFSF